MFQHFTSLNVIAIGLPRANTNKESIMSYDSVSLSLKYEVSLPLRSNDRGFVTDVLDEIRDEAGKDYGDIFLKGGDIILQ